MLWVCVTANPRTLGSLQSDDLKSHAHNMSTGGIASNSLNSGGAVNLAPSVTEATGGAETRPVNTAFLPIINL